MAMATATNLVEALQRRLEELGRRTELAPVEVAVLDSGIDATHPDLAGRIAAAFSVELVDGVPRVVERGPSDSGDVFGHGTAVASVIAQLAPNARLVDIRILGGDNSGTGAVLVAGLKHAVARGSRVINMSLAAKAAFAPALTALCETAYRQNQVVVAAKRNMPLVDFGFPAELSSVISVDRARFETAYRLLYRFGEGDPIEYAANGENVTVAAPGGGYTTKTGTSFAAPAISAFCALLVGAYPDLRPFEVKTLLKAASG